MFKCWDASHGRWFFTCGMQIFFLPSFSTHLSFKKKFTRLIYESKNPKFFPQWGFSFTLCFFPFNNWIKEMLRGRDTSLEILREMFFFHRGIFVHLMFFPLTRWIREMLRGIRGGTWYDKQTCRSLWQSGKWKKPTFRRIGCGFSRSPWVHATTCKWIVLKFYF